MKLSRYQFNNLLVIDDNEAIHEDFRKIFESVDDQSELAELDAEMFGADTQSQTTKAWNYELSFASQGKAGFELLKDRSELGEYFGVAFVDMRMPPGWDGVETIKHLWQADPDLQVVICTAYSDHSWDEITEKLGLSDQLLILRKPFDEIEVVQLAASLCAKRRLLAENKARMQLLEATVVHQGSELQAAHLDAEHLISSISSMLISIDSRGRVSRWNPVAEKLFGIPMARALSQPFHELDISWQSKNQLVEALDQCGATETKQLELQFVDKTGLLRTLDMMICPILNESKSNARLMLASDVSIQKALQIQLDQAQRLESVGQLAAGVAHEINTPMQYIGDNVRYVAKSFGKMAPIFDCLPVLADPNITPEQLSEVHATIHGNFKPSSFKNSLKQIPEALVDSIDGVEAVSKIVAAMKEFSHPGEDQKSQICVNHILRSTVTVAKNEWKYVADVEEEFEEDLVKIDALPSELNQAFLNIVVNAAHAIGDRVQAGDFPKGLIKLKTFTDHEFLNVSIQDNGGGIPVAIRDKIFEPFFTTKEVGKGTGQGLAIAFSVIVQKHQGNFWIEVEEGVGTTFRIQLPREAKMTSDSTNTAHEIESAIGAIE